MATSVKNKIRIGTFFLFLLVITLGALGIFYLVRLSDQSKNILRSNYESLEYAHEMEKTLESIPFRDTAFAGSFNTSLAKQEANITESGEQEATGQVRENFTKLKGGDSGAIHMLRAGIQKIISLNMAAIKLKNEKSERAANKASTILITISSIIFIVAFTFVFNFPSIITDPIRRLTEGIQEVTKRNYSHRVHLESHDEFGQLAEAFNDMAERLQFFESSNLEKLLLEKARAEAVINSLKDASIGIDKTERVLFANEQALHLLGLKAADIVGQQVHEVASRNDLFRFLVNAENTAPFKVVVDGRENYFAKEMVEVRQGHSDSTVIVIKNITSFKELDVAKTNFIATISHELKTPLASSDFSLKLLEDKRTGQLNTEQMELVQNIKQDNQRMLKILSELLNMSQIEAGRIQLNKRMVPPEAVIAGALEAISASAKQKGIRLVKQVNGTLPEIEIDAEKTIWVLNNFLTNAVKNSPPESEILVSAALNDNAVRFSVADKGPGIASEYQDRLFERYFQVPGSKSKGTGLGLAISKDFIEAQGGRIWVESEIGQGANFLFELPVHH